MSLERARAYAASLPSGQRRLSVVSRWFTALDNYTPVRQHANGHAVSFIRRDNNETGYVLFGIDALINPASAVFIVDDGVSVSAMYPVTWHGNGDEFGNRAVLHQFPAGQALSGMHGPARCYHVRILPLGK